MKKRSKAFVINVILMRMKGSSFSEIANELGVEQSTIQNIYYANIDVYHSIENMVFDQLQGQIQDFLKEKNKIIREILLRAYDNLSIRSMDDLEVKDLVNIIKSLESVLVPSQSGRNSIDFEDLTQSLEKSNEPEKLDNDYNIGIVDFDKLKSNLHEDKFNEIQQILQKSG